MLFNLIFTKIIIEICKLACVNLFAGCTCISLFLCRYSRLLGCLYTSWGSNTCVLRSRGWNLVLLKNRALIVNFLKYRWKKKLPSSFCLSLWPIKFKHLRNIDWLRLSVICVVLLSSNTQQGILGNTTALSIKIIRISVHMIKLIFRRQDHSESEQKVIKKI